MVRTVLLSTFLSLVSIVLVLYFVGSPGDLQQVFRIPAGVVGLSVLLQALSYLMGGLRLYVLVRLMGRRLPFIKMLRAYLLGNFSAAITPGGSGHAPAMVMSLQRDGLRASFAWSISLYTSVLDLLFFAWSVPLAILVLAYWLELGIEAYLLVLALPLGLAFWCLWYLLAYRLDLLIRMSFSLLSWKPLRPYRRVTLRSLTKLMRATGLLTSGSYAAHLFLQGNTALLHLSGQGIFWLIATSLGADLQLLPTLAMLLLTSVVGNVIPTPGASGYTEFTVSYLFVQQAQGGLIAPAVLAWRLLTHYSNFLIGPILGGTMLAKTILAQPATAQEEAAAEPAERDTSGAKRP